MNFQPSRYSKYEYSDKEVSSSINSTILYESNAYLDFYRNHLLLAQWEKYYSQFTRLRKKYGSTCMNEDNQDAQFRTWLEVQKNIIHDFQLGQENSVTQNRVMKLVLDSGILDNNDSELEINWNKKLKRLTLYCRENGKCPSNKADSALYRWIKMQRSHLFFDRRSTDRAARMKKLKMFGFDMSKTPLESFVGGKNSQEMEATEDNVDANAERTKINIPIRGDLASFWMCSTCYQRFEKEEEAQNCKCLE